MIQEAPANLTVLLTLQFSEFKGLMCLLFGEEVIVSFNVGLKSFLKGARSGLGILSKVVYGIPIFSLDISLSFFGVTPMDCKYFIFFPQSDL